MKTILLSLLLLSLAVPGWAGDDLIWHGTPKCPSECYWVQTNCDGKDCDTKLFMKADPCLAKMEAAMKDAEWFLTKPLLRDMSYIVPDVDYPGMKKEIHTKAHAMWSQWESTKRECFK